MKEGKLKNGFEFCIEDEALDDMELLDALCEIQNEDATALSKVVHLMLGEKQKKELYKSLRNGSGRVRATDVEKSIAEIFEIIGDEAKNS